MKRLRLALAALALAAGAAFAEDTLRPEVAKPALAANEALRAGQFKEALAKVAEAEAVANRTPYETWVLDRLRAAAATGAGDTALALKSYEAVLAANRLTPEETIATLEGMLGTAAQNKDWPRAIGYARQYQKAGGTKPQVRRVLATALYQSGDHAGAVTELKAMVGEDEAAGRRPPEDQMRMMAAAQLQLKDEAGYARTLESLLKHHPKPAYWRDRLARLIRAPGFDEALTLDVYRLMAAAGAMEDANDYLVLADLSQRATLPAEVQRALEAGIAAGKLNAAEQKVHLDKAVRDAAADVKDWDRKGPPPTAANALVNLGMAQVSAGRAETGLAFIEQGLAKGPARPELVKLRLAWAQAQAGRKAPALATLKELQAGSGALADVARLWAIHLDRPTAQ